MASSTLLPLLFITIALGQVKGPVTINVGEPVTSMKIISNGNTLLLALANSYILKIYENIGYTFAQQTEIALPEKCIYFAVSAQRKTLVVEQDSGLAIVYQMQQNGTYEAIQQLAPVQRLSKPLITEDGKNIFVFENSATIGIYEKINGTYIKQQTIVNNVGILDFQLSGTSNTLALFDHFRNLKIYINNGTFQLNQTINVGPLYGNQLKVTDKNIILAGVTSYFSFFDKIGSNFLLANTLTTNEASIIDFYALDNMKKLIFAGGLIRMEIYNRYNGTYEERYSYQQTLFLNHVNIDESGLYYTYFLANNDVKFFFECPPQCTNCFFPNNCTGCIEDYVLKEGYCVEEPSHCVKNIFKVGNVCQEYCHRKCKTCNQTRHDCYECASLYKMDTRGQCVVESDPITIVLAIRPFLNVVRRKGMKFFFMVLDDLWLYNFHKRRYKGIVKEIFITIKFVEDKQWEIIQLEEVKDQIQTSVTVVQEYNPYSNPTYLFKERKTDLFIDSTYTYFVFFVPFSILMLVLLNKIFYCLFNFEISKFLRPYSFWWIIFQILIMNNVEFFTFLGFRSLTTSMAFDFTSKMLIVLGILMFLLVTVGSFSSYAIYYSKYKKLARYFLVNMFRFPSSYCLMTICYGVRPFLKGAVHALLYDHWVIQIYLLLSIEVIILLIVFYFEMKTDNYKSVLMFMMEVSYFAGLIILNILILLRYEYFKQNTDMEDLFEAMTQVVIFFMFFMLVLRVVWEMIPWSWCKDKKAKNLSKSEVQQQSQKKTEQAEDKEIKEQLENKKS